MDGAPLTRNHRYHSVRIETVHYCEREGILAEKRKRRSFFDRNAEPEDTTKVRLKLLCRTLREDPVRLGRLVEFFKMPYMVRESNQADLARTIAVTPNLRYVDLPEGLFVDDPSFMTLRLEVQARLLNLRKMTYKSGSEKSLQALATGTVWTRLEVLELIRINADPTMLRQVLGCLGNLRALKISETPYINDQVLAWNDLLPPFPPLEEFILNDIPNLTAEGIKAWLSMPEARERLKVITLNKTGVHVGALQEVFANAPALKHMSIMTSVAAAMPSSIGQYTIPQLSSRSLETLHYEILASPSAPQYSSVTSSYYHYLAGSLLSGGLPNLRAVYVRDPDFIDLLLGLPPPVPAYADGGIARPASSGSNTPFSARYSHVGSSPFGSFSPPGAGGGVTSPHTSPHGGRGTSLSSPQGPGGQTPKPFGSPPAANPRFSSNNPFASLAGPGGGPVANLPLKLEVFTKGDDDQGWHFMRVPAGGMAAARQGGSPRPLSSYGMGADALGGNALTWTGAGSRHSVLVGGAGGGFLAVPDKAGGGGGGGGGGGSRAGGGLSFGGGGGQAAEEEDFWPRPLSGAELTKKERKDLWR